MHNFRFQGIQEFDMIKADYLETLELMEKKKIHKRKSYYNVNLEFKNLRIYLQQDLVKKKIYCYIFKELNPINI